MATLTTPLPCAPLHNHTQHSLSFISCAQSSLFLTSPFRPFIKHLVCKCNPVVPNCKEPYNQIIISEYQRPTEVPWKKELCNSVQLIGIVGVPVQINHLSSGKVVASTRITVRKSATSTSWINLTFWDELAHIAHQHLEKGNQIYVSGRLVSDTVETDDGKQQTYYKVVVQQLNFVEKSFPSPVALYDDNSNSTASARKFDNSTTISKSSVEELWQAFFANPLDWWDNRNKKKNPKSPDFKHKDTGEALWVDGRYNPTWVKSQLEVLDSRMQSFQNHDDGRDFNFLNAGDYPPF